MPVLTWITFGVCTILNLALLWFWAENPKKAAGFCKNCKYTNFNGSHFECRKFPPRYNREVGNQNHFAFPEMGGKDWCWEYKKGVGGFVLPLRRVK